ncbi:MAG: T9SS type A sorting domain-containing protein [Bacteroidetes bacterium]|nr:T9SS type A sorting domain-containing protein [Bacteroidota bacterium]MDA1336686.1 T9SS type A sorting domain-containing protein [Bacteroidota bacterium]
MKRFLLLLLVGVLVNCVEVSAQSPTFHADIAPIIYQNCTQCHRAGEIGPMPFTTYDEVYDYREFIAYVTSTGYMPPWTPDPEYATLRGERFLSEEQIQTLVEWAEGEALEGDVADNPGLPDFPEGSQIGEPDLILSMPEPYVHGGDMTDQYQVFILETEVEEETEIRAIEVRPGNSAVAHHALIAYTESTMSIEEAQSMDAADPEPGYESFGDYGVFVEDFLFGGWVPGAAPTDFPATIGKKIGPDGKLLLQMHYGPSPVEETDVTEINLFFAEEPVQREVELAMMTPGNLTEPFFIQPNEVKTFHGIYPVFQDVSILSITPHCHLLGQTWEVYAVSANAQDTIPLISIPQWDFNWQGIFSYPSLKHIPAGYNVHAFCTYDNTADNPNNPNDPPQWMSWGDLTGDEMYVLFFQYVPYLPGDENITLSAPDEDTRLVYQTDNLFPAWPNPARANQTVNVSWHLHAPARLTLELLDIRGRVVDTWLPMQSFGAGHHQRSFMLGDLNSGTYFYRMTTEDGLVRSHTIQVID